MAETVDPNSNLTGQFKESKKPTESIRIVSKTPDPEAEAMVRGSIQRGTNAKRPHLNKQKNSRSNRKR